MSQRLEMGVVARKFPKFTKKRPRTPEPATEDTPLPGPTMSPLTPMPESPSSIPNTTPPVRRPIPSDCALKRTHFGQAPIVCGPWDGKVASHGLLSGFVITSPMQTYIPHMPKDVDVVSTFIDGRWGAHEYSRHPQWYIQDMTHIACIPRQPSPPSVPDILFLTLRQHEHWEEDPSVAVHGLGRICLDVRSALRSAADAAIDGTIGLESDDDRVQAYRGVLVLLIRQMLTRMAYLPSVASRAITIAAHIQRLCLELAGLSTYLKVVIPRMKSSQDFSKDVLDVVGGFLREGAVTQTWHRVGIPYWVLQPLTKDIVVYNVVAQQPLPFDLATGHCDPPILHRAGSFVGVSNLTGSWVSQMVLSMSTHVAGSHLASLDLVSVPAVHESGGSSQKRARIEAKDLANPHLRMRPAEVLVGVSKGARRRKRRQAEDGPIREGSADPMPQKATAAEHGTNPTCVKHPSRIFCESPFVEVVGPWVTALIEVSPLPQTTNSALYFYPPPFLLDTFASISQFPPNCPHPDRARADTKVNRYVHNFLRIREFCRLRLFDVSLQNRPLTIGEWRAALWGDYLPQTSVRSGGQGSEARRAERRLGERNGVGALFHKVAHMDTYSVDNVVYYEGQQYDLASISSDVALRQSLLWESHEVNFRAEMIALDALLVQTKDWDEISRWEREMLVSGVWGVPTSGASVVADTAKTARLFCWYSPPHDLWQTCRERLRHFTLVLSRWPDCPEMVIRAGKGLLEQSEYAEVQRQAIHFYVRTFVSRFARLPIPPVLPQ